MESQSIQTASCFSDQFEEENNVFLFVRKLWHEKNVQTEVDLLNRFVFSMLCLQVEELEEKLLDQTQEVERLRSELVRS